MEFVWDNVSFFYGNLKAAQPRFVRIVGEPGVGRAANTLSWLTKTQFRLGDRDVVGRPGVREACRPFLRRQAGGLLIAGTG